MAIAKVDGHPAMYTVESGDEFSILPQGGCVYTDADLTVTGRLVSTDPLVPVISGGAALTLLAGVNVIEAGSLPARIVLTGAATRIVVYNLISA